MRRIDKRANHVEISPEQLTAIVIDTEVVALCCGIYIIATPVIKGIYMANL